MQNRVGISHETARPWKSLCCSALPKVRREKKTWFKQKEQAHDHALFIHANAPTFQINLEIVFGQTSLSEEPGGRYSFAGVGRG